MKYSSENKVSEQISMETNGNIAMDTLFPKLY